MELAQQKAIADLEDQLKQNRIVLNQESQNNNEYRDTRATVNDEVENEEDAGVEAPMDENNSHDSHSSTPWRYPHEKSSDISSILN